MEFSKFLLIFNYIIFLGLVTASMFYDQIATIAAGWIGILAVGTGFYFWKAKAENRLKLPMYLLIKLPKEFRDDVDMTELLKCILGE